MTLQTEDGSQNTGLTGRSGTEAWGEAGTGSTMFRLLPSLSRFLPPAYCLLPTVLRRPLEPTGMGSLAGTFQNEAL